VTAKSPLSVQEKILNEADGNQGRRRLFSDHGGGILQTSTVRKAHPLRAFANRTESVKNAIASIGIFSSDAAARNQRPDESSTLG
jgi:hypothetical protein